MSTTWALVLSLILLALNAFFVAAEFALVGSKRYRLEQAAADGSRAARAALDGARELSVMLAGAQLGITLCTLGLGALAEPAIEHVLGPVLHAVGLPDTASHVIGFIVALLLVGFLHLVVGEMAPKSWAITNPERSALLLALPFRAFARLTRPALILFNGLANAMLRLVKVEPQDQLAQVHGPEELRILLEQSREHGTLAADQEQLLTSLLQLQRTTVASVMQPRDELVTVPADATAERIEAISRGCGRSRLAVSGTNGELVGLVHVRDAVRATTFGRPSTATDFMTEPFTLPATATVTEAVAAMRADRAQLALVRGDERTVGFVALEDLLEEVIGEFDDETDAVPQGRRMR
ncbi:hemolysin family protein [Phytohabitans suffuscus]|uniref:Membrane protein n=1 Tax=Phytohabitans suffuscus TaxID=624315 RepID=A0A6F8YP01_9ACTN|nr:hemolysin family protein [Phytohabitans suffuscus]BCB87766.1 membrane protein [Phytohabitans suffuscus]